MANGSVNYFDGATTEYVDSLAAPDFQERFRLFGTWLRRLAAGAEDELTCIDLGCGPGRLSVEAAACGFNVIGIDGSAAMLREADRLAAASKVEVALRQALLPLSPADLAGLVGSADAIVCSSVIEYVADDRALLAQCGELLRPGGHALVSFLNGASAFWKLERYGRHTPAFRSSRRTQRKHVHTEASARDLAANAGLEVVAVNYFGMRRSLYKVWRSSRRPPWISNLFLLVAQRPPL